AVSLDGPCTVGAEPRDSRGRTRARARDHAGAGRGGVRGHPHQAPHHALPACAPGAGRRSRGAGPARMTDAAPVYAIEHGEVERDRERVLAYRGGSLGSDTRMQSEYDRFYSSCTYGKPLICLLRHLPDDSLVGAAAKGPRRMFWRGEASEAGVL